MENNELSSGLDTTIETKTQVGYVILIDKRIRELFLIIASRCTSNWY